MPELKIRQGVWDGLKAAAEKRGEPPTTLANRALEEYLRRLADEELLARSQRTARRATIPLADTEQAIRKYRASK